MLTYLTDQFSFPPSHLTCMLDYSIKEKFTAYLTSSLFKDFYLIQSPFAKLVFQQLLEKLHQLICVTYNSKVGEIK